MRKLIEAVDAMPENLRRRSNQGRNRMKSLVPTIALSFLLGATGAHAQAASERTIEEIKVETQARADRGGYPLIGLDPEDVRQALSNINTRDRDEWAAAWSAVADRYYKAAETAYSPEEKRKNYLRAWRLYFFGQWPVAASEGKKAAYAKALNAFLRISDSANGGRPHPVRGEGDRRLPATSGVDERSRTAPADDRCTGSAGIAG
jgi:hypothetical protein